MLKPHGVASFLIRENLLSPEAVVTGDLRIVPASRRHYNYRVTNTQGISYFLKQGILDKGFASVAHEAAILQGLQSNGVAKGLIAYLPKFYRYCPQSRILVTEFLREGQDLRSYYSQHSRVTTTLARQLGSALAGLHTIPPQVFDAIRLPYAVVHPPPWVFDLPRPRHRILKELSRASRELIKILQRYPEFATHFDRLRGQWRTNTVIHYDIKLDNCLADLHYPSGRRIRLKIIDWEFAGIGDASWDVGGVLHEYLNLWITSLPMGIDLHKITALGLDRNPISTMRPAIQSFWNTYAARTGLQGSEADEFLNRSVEFAGVRAVQTAYELTQNSSQIHLVVLYLLQCALNILERPQEAATTLFGLASNG